MNRIIASILILIAGLSSAACGATYYVGPAATGSASGGDRSNLMAFSAFRDTTSTAGDIALLQPGSYSMLFNGEGGTNAGALGNHIIYRADPASCTARSTDWFSRTTDLESPNPAIHVVAETVEFRYWRTAGSFNTATPYRITLDGVWATGLLYINGTVADVTVSNCNFMPGVGTYYSTTSSYGIYLRHIVGSGSDIRDILIEDCYVNGSIQIMGIQGIVRGPLRFHGVRGTNCGGSFVSYQPSGGEHYDTTIIEDSHFDRYVQIPYDASTVISRIIVEVDGENPRTRFRIDSDVSATYMDFIDFTHEGTPKQALQAVGTGGIDHGTLWVTLPTEAPWDLTTDDVPRFYDDCHGSGLAIRADDLTVRRCQFHNLGDTAGVYIYKSIAPNTGAADVNVTDSLFYSIGNGVWGVAFGGTYDDLGDNFTFKNNTVIGRYSSDDTGRAYCHYGRALIVQTNAAADTSTWNISNNLIVGLIQGSMGNAVRCGNIVYAHGTIAPYVAAGELLDGADPNNTGNLVIYAGEAWGFEPEPFDQAGTYFVASAGNFDDVLTTYPFNYNLSTDFQLKAGSPAIDAGSAANGTATDLIGWIRTATPDVGAWEYEAISPYVPGAATSPSPANGAVWQLSTVNLGWTTGDNSPTHHVFFGTDIDDVASGTGGTDKGTQAGTTYEPGALSFNTVYYWRIQEENDDGTTTGTVWWFQTRLEPEPKHGLIGRKGKK